ncbi:MAG: alpha/beta hydrolase, partial [Pseudomonadales bacterium]
FIDLVFDVVDETNNLAELTHDEVVQRTARSFARVEPVKAVAQVITDVEGVIASTVFKSIRGINGATRLSVNTINHITEAGLGQSLESNGRELTTPMQSSAAGTVNWCIDYLQSSLNGLWGDYLSQKNSALDTKMTLRHNGRDLPIKAQAVAAAYPNPTNKICVFVHGLAATEWLWTFSSAQHYEGDTGTSFGSRLYDDLGYTPIYIRYNSGKHISDNGRQLAALISELVEAYPVPIEEIALIGHSMGGLVARSAASYGHEQKQPWVDSLRHVACVGAPNLGAPLEKAVNLLTGVLQHIDAAAAQVSSRFLNSRSAGIKDLRYGYTVDDEWLGKDPDAVFTDDRLNVPLVDGVGYYFFAATVSKDSAHPLGRLFGDLLVRLPSASGEAIDPARRIPFASGGVFQGISHIHIVNHPDVYEVLRDCFSGEQ